eukprot:5671306-Prymnesium_polylepis.1
MAQHAARCQSQVPLARRHGAAGRPSQRVDRAAQPPRYPAALPPSVTPFAAPFAMSPECPPRASAHAPP